MGKDFSRSRRLGEQIQRELAELIQREVKDPRLGMVTVSGVEVSRDLAHAKVYITLLGDTSLVEQNLAVLRQAAGFLRRELGRRIKARKVPELHFAFDSSIESGSRMDALIAAAIAADKKDSEEN